MIYFDNAATGGYKPSTVIEAAYSSIRYINANAGRSGHRLAVAAGLNVLKTRQALKEFFNGDAAERVIFTKNCTEALNIAIFGTYEKNCHIVSTVTEHNSVLRPLNYLKSIGEIDFSLAPIDSGGNVSPESVISLITPNTKILVLNLVSNVTGNLLDIKSITDYTKNLGITVIADGAQACGHIDIDMKELGIDILCVAGHKGMHAIQGASCLIFNDKIKIRPLMRGGTGSESINLSQPDVYPERLESGTINYPAIISLYEGVLYLKKNMTAFSRTLITLTAELIDGLKRINKIDIYSNPNPFGIVSFKHPALPSEEIAYILSEKYDIAVRGGLHCAPLLHEALGSDSGLVRVSFSPQNKRGELLTFLKAISDIV